MTRLFLGLILVNLSSAGTCPDLCQCMNDKMIVCPGGLKKFPVFTGSEEFKEFLSMDNEIPTLPPLAHVLPKLKVLNLSKNKVAKISRGRFPDSIQDAWLDDNVIKSISSKIFSNLPNLMRIYLRNVSSCFTL